MSLNKRLITVLILILLLNLIQETYAGGWTKKKGKFYLQLSSQLTRANKFHDVNGSLVPINTLGDYAFSIYAEYGLNDNFTIVTYFPFFRHLTLNRIEGKQSGKIYFSGAEKNGVSDANLGIRYKLANLGQSVLSAGLSFGLPIGDANQKDGLLTGDGESDQQISLQFGHSFYPLPVYFSASAGYDFRHKGFTDELHYSVEAGYTFFNKLLIILRAYGIKPVYNGNNTVTGSAGGLYSNNQQYLNYGPELFYNVTENWGITTGVNSAIGVRNALSGFAYRLGFFILN